jgi:hypothetical protein
MRGRQTIKTSISIDREVLANAKAVARLLGFRHSLSAYITETISRDIECHLPKKHPSALIRH